MDHALDVFHDQEREKRLQAARLEEEARFQQECTFKPKINKKSEKMLRRRTGAGGKPQTKQQQEQAKAVERLHDVRSDVPATYVFL